MDSPISMIRMHPYGRGRVAYISAVKSAGLKEVTMYVSLVIVGSNVQINIITYYLITNFYDLTISDLLI